MVLMNLRTQFDMFLSTFCTNWRALKEDGKEYTFEYSFGILITDQHRLIEEGNLGGKHQDHFIKVKGKSNY
jgi:hypothetical protein